MTRMFQLGQFEEEEDADDQPLLTFARLQRYIPALKTFVQNRCPQVLGEVHRLVRELRQGYRN